MMLSVETENIEKCAGARLQDHYEPGKVKTIHIIRRLRPQFDPKLTAKE